MPTVRVSDFATGLACAGFLIAALAQIALDYTRFHGVAPGLRLPLEVLGPVAIMVGAVAYVLAARRFVRLRGGEAGRVLLGPVASGAAGLLVVVLGLLMGFGLHLARAGFSGEARLTFDMAMHAMIAAPALAAVLLRYQSGRTAAA